MSVSDSPQLERRYRRLLALYPKAFRHEHENELLSVLLAGARAGQTRPSLAEAFDLITHAIFMRVRRTQVPGPWEYRHARVMGSLRILIGLWLVLLTGILYGYGRGGWWGMLLVPAAALHFYIAFRLSRPAES